MTKGQPHQPSSSRWFFFGNSRDNSNNCLNKTNHSKYTQEIGSVSIDSKSKRVLKKECVVEKVSPRKTRSHSTWIDRICIAARAKMGLWRSEKVPSSDTEMIVNVPSVSKSSRKHSASGRNIKGFSIHEIRASTPKSRNTSRPTFSKNNQINEESHDSLSAVDDDCTSIHGTDIKYPSRNSWAHFKADDFFLENAKKSRCSVRLQNLSLKIQRARKNDTSDDSIYVDVVGEDEDEVADIYSDESIKERHSSCRKNRSKFLSKSAGFQNNPEITDNPYSTRKYQLHGTNLTESNQASDCLKNFAIESSSVDNNNFGKDEEIITPTFRLVTLPGTLSPFDEDIELSDCKETKTHTFKKFFTSNTENNKNFDWQSSRSSCRRPIRIKNTCLKNVNDSMASPNCDYLTNITSNHPYHIADSKKRIVTSPLIINKNNKNHETRHLNQNNNQEEVKDEIYEKRHRPLELVEKRTRKREIELMQYAEHLNRLRKEAPQLWA